MKKIFLSSALALSLAAPAFASDQLALSLGVEPGAYTTAELVQLRRAQEDNDPSTIDFILSGGSNLDPATSERLGLQVALDRAVEEGDYTLARYLRTRLDAPANGAAAADSVTEVPAHLLAVAASLDIDAADYTVGELVALEQFQEEGDSIRVRGLISRVSN